MFKSPLILLHFLVFLWGFTGIVAKLISIHPTPKVFLRMMMAALVLYIYNRWKGFSIKIPTKSILKIIFSGVILGFHWVTFFQSIQVSNVSVGTSMLSAGALFTALLEPLFFRRKVDYKEIVLGIIIIICVGVMMNVETQYLLGIIIGLIAAFLSALNSVVTAKLRGEAPAEVIVFHQLFWGGLVVGIFMLFEGSYTDIAKTTTSDWIYLFILSAILTVYPMVQSVNLMKYISPYTLMLTVNLEPIYSVILALFIFPNSEKMSFAFYITALFLIGSVFINGWLKSREKS